MSEETRVSAEVAWLELSAGVVAGLHHALNNRLGALSAVAQVLASELEGHPLQEALGREVEHLHRTVRLLELLPRRDEALSTPLQVEEVVNGAVSLYRLHHELRDVPCTVVAHGEVAPVYGDPARLAQLLVALLADAGVRASRLDGGGVRVGYRGDERWVYLSVEVSAGDTAFPAMPSALRTDVRAAEPWVRREGGELNVREDADGGALFTLRLPTLAEARSRENGSAR
jgi:signal transduction histidine kinase